MYEEIESIQIEEGESIIDFYWILIQHSYLHFMLMINHFLYLGFLLVVNTFLNMNKTCALEMIIQLSPKIPIMKILKILIIKNLKIPIMKFLKILMMKTVQWSHINPWVILPFLWYNISMFLDVLKTCIMSLIPKRNLSQILNFWVLNDDHLEVEEEDNPSCYDENDDHFEE